jgi:hypothetical protein
MLMLLMGIGQESRTPRVAITGKMVEVSAPIQVTTESDVQEFYWLNGGRYLVYLRDANPYKQNYISVPGEPQLFRMHHANALYLFNTKTRRITPLHQNNIVYWTVALGGRAVLYAVQQEVRRREGDDEPSSLVSGTTTLYLRFAEQGSPRTIAQFKTPYLICKLSPDGRYLLTIPDPTQLIDLQTGQVVQVFEPGFGTAVWVSNAELYLRRWRAKTELAGYACARYDLRTHRLEPISDELYKQAIQAAWELQNPACPTTTRNLTLGSEGISREANRLDLCSRNAHTERFRCAAVAYDADGQHYSIAPDESGIAYRSWRGQLFYIPLGKRDPETLPEQLACGQKPTEEAIRKHYLSNGKQIAVAALMYCQDYDELFPPNNNITELLLPYLKDKDVFLDAFTGQPIFTYLLDGQSLASIESPAETRLGILDYGDPNWVVVLYADGHTELKRRE